MGKDDLSNVKVECPKGKGALVAEVLTYKSGFKRSKHEPLSGVKVKFDEATKSPDQTTGGSGRTTVLNGLDPGSYTVSLEFTPEMKELYDVPGSTTQIAKDVKKGKTTPYPFEVPWFWIEYQVQYDGTKTFVPGIDYVLRHKKPDPADSPWTQNAAGTTGLSKEGKDKVPRGRYQLDLKLVYEPVWGDPHVEIDKAIEIKAAVSGFDVGTAGSIQIVDAHTLAPALHTIAVQVAKSADNSRRELKTTWTPTKEQLKDLKSAKIAFRAAVGASFVFSEPETVYIKEKYQVVDGDGNNLSTTIDLYFSGGHSESKQAEGGQTDVLVPWNETVARVFLRDYHGSSVGLDEGGIATRRFHMPA
jgi:hypothetical protein